MTFVFLVRSGQYDDLETPPRRMLFDDVQTRRPGEEAVGEEASDPENPSIGT